MLTFMQQAGLIKTVICAFVAMFNGDVIHYTPLIIVLLMSTGHEFTLT